MADPIIDAELSDGVSAHWERFIDEIEPLRPDLFRLALRLSGNAFDAEDLVHDALLRAFGSLGFAYGNLRSPRAYLFRILTNLWIDECRRMHPTADPEAVDRAPDPARSGHGDEAALRDAAALVLDALTPRERVAVVLKEGFDLSHAEIAELLSSSVAAVRVALHRGRRRLAAVQEEPPRAPRASRELVEQVVAAFRAGDPRALVELLLENVEATNFPSGLGIGTDALAKRGWIYGCLYHHIPEREERGEVYPLGLEVRDVEGEPVVLVYRDYGEGTALEEVWRFEEEEGSVARIRDYCFSPDLVRWVAERCGVPFRNVAYRFRPGRNRDDAVPPSLPERTT